MTSFGAWPFRRIEPLSGELEKQTHDRLLVSLTRDLEESGWAVEAEPMVGTVQPDVVATTPDGGVYVFEVKSTGAHLGAVAQVEAYRDSLSALRGTEARGVLVVQQDAPAQLDEVAQRANVEVLRVGPDPQSLAVSIKDFTQNSGEL
jgi:RecB family endonuclease NucS